MKYDKYYLQNTLDLMKDLIDDLDKWSVYNNDLYNEEVAKLKSAFKNLDEKI